MRLRTTGGPIGPGGLTSGGQVGWTPRSYSGRLFSATAPTVPNTSNGAHVASLADDYLNGVALAQATSSKQLIVDTATPLNGYAAWTVSNAAVTDMSIASGGVAGGGDHTMTWVGNIPTFASGFNAMLVMGTAVAGSNIGTTATSFWGGRAGNASPGASVGVDTANHVYTKILRSGVVSLYQDGSLMLAGLADASYANAAGMRIGGGFSGAVDGRLRHCLFASAAASLGRLGDKAKHERWIARQFPSLVLNRIIIGLGDSQTAGTAVGSPSTVGSSWISQIAALMSNAYDVYWDGTGLAWSSTAVGGWLTTDVLSNYTLGAVGRYSGLRPRSIANVWIGTNDLYGAAGTRTRDATATYTNITTIVQGLMAAGHDTYVMTPLPRTQSGTPATYAADQVALSAMILANTAGATGTIDVGNAAAFSNPNNTTNYQGGAVPGVHLNPTGNAIVAAMAAAAYGPS